MKPINAGFAKPLTLFALMAMGQTTWAQKRTTPVADTSTIPPAKSNTKGPRSYSDVITTRTLTRNGMFTVHKQDDRYFFEIPDSLIGRDILVVNRIAKAAAQSRTGMEGYAGDRIGDKVVRFEKGQANKLFLKTISFSEVSADSSENGMYRSVKHSNLQPIAAAFDIKTYGNASTIVDVTDWVSSDNELISFESLKKRAYSLSNMLADRSYIDSIRIYPNNLEIRTIRTYNRSYSVPGVGSISGEPATFELNSSWLLLPKEPMRPRQADARVGYFSDSNIDFDAPQGIKKNSFITRWRLEPKKGEEARYLKGELTEPQKPIVFYIDPTTPQKWIPFLIQGVNDWNIAFEKAGWKNAVIAREAPVNDSSWSLEDARHSAIVYKPSAISNASGPHISDPRSGEIMETHINWFHNVMSLLHNWYFIQAAPNDPRARTMNFPDDLMGQLIRFVSSHEVGHTLGLSHNFGASSFTPVEKLRDAEWLKKNGHTVSIMDYARFNYVAQPGDKIGPEEIFPRIGIYDQWAIEWGYRWFPEGKTAQEEQQSSSAWVTQKLAANPQLRFLTSSASQDSRAQTEDLGDNAMKASDYGIENLKRIVPNLLQWTAQPQEDYSNAGMMYTEVVHQYNRYLRHVVSQIGGILTTPRKIEEQQAVLAFVPKKTQKEAMQFFRRQLFVTPTWLVNKELYLKTGTADPASITRLQDNIIERLLSASVLQSLQRAENIDGSNAYSIADLLKDLQDAIFTELAAKPVVDQYRRNLQKAYTERICTLYQSGNEKASSSYMEQQNQLKKNSDASVLLKAHMKSLVIHIKQALTRTTHAATKLHLEFVLEQFDKTINPK